MSFWDERFSGSQYRYGTQPNRFLTEAALRLPAAARVIAAGDGEGRNGVWLAQQGHRVLAVDGSAVGLEKARQLAAERGTQIETLQADLADYAPPPASVDAVVLIYVHLPPDIRPFVHRNLIRALKQGGLFILEAFHRQQLHHDSGGPRDPALLYDLATLAEDFGTDLELVTNWDGQVHLDEGPGHQGIGHVVRVLATRR